MDCLNIAFSAEQGDLHIQIAIYIQYKRKKIYASLSKNGNVAECRSRLGVLWSHGPQHNPVRIQINSPGL